MSNLNAFIAYLEEQVKNHSIYVWGAQGQMKPTIMEDWITKRETSAVNAGRAIAFWQKQVKAGYGDVLRAFDCSGLGMYFLQNMTGLYKGDMSANTMMGKCGKIARNELKRGDWVFRVDAGGKAYHIGYVVDDQLNVIEAMGRDAGVVKRPLSASGTSYWNAYGRPEVFAKEIGNGAAGSAAVLKITSPLMRSADIQSLQIALNALGYPCGTADGICGNKTLEGVRAFVKSHVEV